MDESRTYPYPAGDVMVLGPEIFVSSDEAVICWRGVNYVRQDDPEARVASDEGRDPCFECGTSEDDWDHCAAHARLASDEEGARP